MFMWILFHNMPITVQVLVYVTYLLLMFLFTFCCLISKTCRNNPKTVFFLMLNGQ